MRLFVFFKQKTAYEMRISDWSSDVCSSDLNAIGFRKNTGQQFMWIFNGFRSIFTTAKHRNVVHRSRTVEGDQRDNVTKVCWLYLSQRLAHSFRFQLEHADRVAPFQKVVYRPIVPFEQIEIDIDATFLQQLHGFLKYRKGLETQKIKLYQSCPFTIFHVELSEDRKRQ